VAKGPLKLGRSKATCNFPNIKLQASNFKLRSPSARTFQPIIRLRSLHSPSPIVVAFHDGCAASRQSAQCLARRNLPQSRQRAPRSSRSSLPRLTSFANLDFVTSCLGKPLSRICPDSGPPFKRFLPLLSEFEWGQSGSDFVILMERLWTWIGPAYFWRGRDGRRYIHIDKFLPTAASKEEAVERRKSLADQHVTCGCFASSRARCTQLRSINEGRLIEEKDYCDHEVLKWKHRLIRVELSVSAEAY
jgi:hypothetical protein